METLESLQTLVIDYKNGHKQEFKLIQDGGILPLAYPIETPDRLVEVLERCRKNRTRVKVNLGNIETGKSWNEENDTTGYISMSKGHAARFPILVHNSSSMGGGSLMTDNILKVSESKGGRVLYQAANFQPSVIEVKDGSNLPEYTHEVWVNGELYGRCKSLKRAILLKNKIA
tara:strand:+ start:24 stop:542 length:519 start_codon:yes stop_codon:yes gene_type:complete